MKKLAGLLAVVMILTACPILGVSAAELTDADLGLDQLKVAKTIDCKTDGTAPSGTTTNTTWGSNSAITFDTTNGMKMVYSTWDMNEGSCPLKTYKAFRFKGKLEGGKLDVRAGYAERNISVWLNITAGSYSYRDASKAQHPTAFEFPAGWVDFLILPFSDGYDFYCKAEGASGWTEVGKRLEYDANTSHGTFQIGNLHSDKATAASYVSEVLLYQDASAPTPTATPTPTAAPEAKTYTEEELMGEGVGVAISKNFGDPGEVIDGDFQIDNAGMPFSEEYKGLRFRAALNQGGTMNVRGGKENGRGIYYNLSATDIWVRQRTVEASSSQTVNYSFGTGVRDFLIVPSADTWAFYTKNITDTKWVLVSDQFKYDTDCRATFYCGGKYTLQRVDVMGEAPPPPPPREFMTDPEEILGENRKIWFYDDFSEDTGLWTYSNGFERKDGKVSVVNGVAKDIDTVNAVFPKAVLDTSTIQPTGTYYIRFKTQVDAQALQCNFAVGGQKRYWFQSKNTKPGEVWEYLLAFEGSTSVSVYRRLVGGDGEWKTVTEDATLANYSAGNHLEFHTAKEGATAWIDDLMIYEGPLVEADVPVLEAGKVTTKGSYLPGAPDYAYDRYLSTLTVVYDKKRGYTKAINTADYTSVNGAAVDFSGSFAASNATAEDPIALLVWHDIETGLPLHAVIGQSVANTSTAKPATGQDPAITYNANFNEVKLNGYTGIKNGIVTASLSDKTGKVVAAIQSESNEDGMIDVGIAIDPALPSDTYTLRVQFGNTVATAYEVKLYTSDLPINSITDKAAMENFLKDFGSTDAKKWLSDATFASDVYNKFKEENKTFADLYEFRDALDPIVEYEVTERTVRAEVAAAAKAEKWGDLQNLIMNTYREFLGIEEDAIDGIESKKDLFLRMSGDYDSTEALVKDFEASVTAQKEAEKKPGGSQSGTTGGYVGAIYGTGVVSVSGAPKDEDPVPLAPDDIKVLGFDDLASVEWARESIMALWELGVVNGNGDGKFDPDRSITREEFLKMILMAAGIEPATDADLAFTDVEKGAWYYGYIAAANRKGIVNGITETQFGVGQQITRADMAVMLKRVMDSCEIAAEPVKAAFVYDDFAKIPKYARESIASLSEASLMNGVGENTFMPLSSATRAEAATAIYRIYNYMEERR